MREQTKTLKKVLGYVRPHLTLLLFSLLLALLGVAATLSIPVLVGRAIDSIVGVGQVDFAAVRTVLLWLVVLIAVAAVAQWSMQVIHNRITYHVVRDIRNETIEKLQRLPLRYLDAHPAGEIVSRIITDAEQLADGLLMGFSQLFTGIVTILGTIGLMIYIDPVTTLIVVLVTPRSLLVSK